MSEVTSRSPWPICVISSLNWGSVTHNLGTRGTGRNWNTVLKLGALVNEERA